MESTLETLIPDSATGEPRVDHAELERQLVVLHPACFGWALACCGRRREDAEDLLHDVYVRVLENGLRFDGRSTFKTWLFGVIARTARARLRRERLRALLGVRHANGVAPTQFVPSPADDAVAADRRERTQSALTQLPKRQREVLLLVFYHDFTVEEAARVMRVSVGSARVHYQRGKQRLAALLPQEHP